MLKKIILVAMFCVSSQISLLSAGLSQNFNAQRAYELSDAAVTGSVYYYFKDGDTYVFSKRFDNFLLKYDNGKFVRISPVPQDINTFQSVGIPVANDYNLKEQFQVRDNLYVRFDPYKTEPIEIVDSGKIYTLTDCFYIKDVDGTYGNSNVYIDYANLKFYFMGEISGETGIAVCDLKTKEAYLILKDNEFGSTTGYSLNYSPVRIPNTGYLTFYQINSSFLGASPEDYENTVSNSDFMLMEIPEWKQEMDLQNKNEQMYPPAARYFIKGPAKVYDSPSGQSVSVLGDLTKVLALSQKGDWYEVLYANIRGWMHKDNLSKITELNK